MIALLPAKETDTYYANTTPFGHYVNSLKEKKKRKKKRPKKTKCRKPLMEWKRKMTFSAQNRSKLKLILRTKLENFMTA